MLPAPGQGALAVECRAPTTPPTPPTVDLLAGLDDAATRPSSTAERTLLATLEAGCSAPVGAYARSEPEGERRPRAVPAGRRHCRRRLRAACGCPPPDLSTRQPARPRPRGRPARRGCRRTDVGARPVTRPKHPKECHRRQPRKKPRRWAASPSSAPAPATPDAATVRAAELLAEADVVVTEIAGRRPSSGGSAAPTWRSSTARSATTASRCSHAVRARLRRQGGQGRPRVVRLLVGDPFLSAHRLAEEAAGCAKARCRSRSCPASRRSPRSRPTPASR